ncbi:MAG: hypothetical protein LBG59_08885 [Candidatus Peribacteria bacterium]|jgi:hypothetical protein|nr:hypothetical protein [Candidatus Peribacteria bacterium]
MSLLCFFLVACTPQQHIEDTDSDPLLSEDTIDGTLSGSSFVDSDPQVISFLISFEE